ncbi:DUF922 domain-containing protein [Chryseobacterium sp. PTM-20240506]|uniref:DUF922 domain-containing protein n=1 Tax=unclassified Chryseobacterium TaxID=2593645 RepID=UPI0023595097|nr:DUF922 domain-containing protein [Chryseobacterium sp. B21-037]MDC8103668.1 DUF922 domain-containing protein [Chryseobacterium sp. B21-037]
MKWTIFICLLVSVQIFGQKIIWKEDQKLTWDDFKSPVSRKSNKDVVAYTHCGWEYSVVTSSNPASPVKIEVLTIFNKDKSWKDVKRINDYVLLHEQKHFDIAELYARKLRKEVMENIKTAGDYQKKFKAIYDRVLHEYRDFQIAYDKETQNGMNKEKQAEYNTSITEQLDQLNSYKKS